MATKTGYEINQEEAALIACENRESNLSRCYLKLREALLEIERFGHGFPHGAGHTCADMAARALNLPTRINQIDNGKEH